MGATPATESIADALLTALRAIDGTGDYNYDLTGADLVIEGSTLQPTGDGVQVALGPARVQAPRGPVMGRFTLTLRFDLMGWAPASASRTGAREAGRLLNDCVIALDGLLSNNPVITALDNGECIDLYTEAATLPGEQINNDLYAGLGFFSGEIVVTAEVTKGI